MTTPQELLEAARSNLATADGLWVERGLHTGEGEVSARIAQANAQALLAIGMLLHERFHPEPQAQTPMTPREQREHLDALISEASTWGMAMSEVRDALADELPPDEVAPDPNPG